MMSFSAGNQSAQLVSKSPAKRNAAIIPKSTSSDSLDRLGQGMRKPVIQPGPNRSAIMKPAVTSKNARDTSRVEVLLAQKTFKQAFQATEESALSQATNKAIKQSALWTEVQKAVLEAKHITPSNAAFAIHRLGCLNCFASRKRKADLAASGLTSMLLQTATADSSNLDAPWLVLTLDGCARLQHPVPTEVLESLASSAQCMAPSFDSLQLPLVLWAFSVLKFAPPVYLLNAFDEIVPRLAEAMSPQSICLTLRGFQAPQFKPSHRTMNCLSEQLYRMLPIFKPSEVACCLEAFSHFNYQPPSHIIAAILISTGKSLPSDEPMEPYRDQNLPAVISFPAARAEDGRSKEFIKDPGPSAEMIAAIRSNVRNVEVGFAKLTAIPAVSKLANAEHIALP